MSAYDGIAVWIEWWSRANTIAPNKDLGTYLSVYWALSVGGYIAIVLLIW